MEEYRNAEQSWRIFDISSYERLRLLPGMSVKSLDLTARGSEAVSRILSGPIGCAAIRLSFEYCKNVSVEFERGEGRLDAMWVMMSAPAPEVEDEVLRLIGLEVKPYGNSTMVYISPKADIEKLFGSTVGLYKAAHDDRNQRFDEVRLKIAEKPMVLPMGRLSSREVLEALDELGRIGGIDFNLYASANDVDHMVSLNASSTTGQKTLGVYATTEEKFNELLKELGLEAKKETK